MFGKLRYIPPVCLLVSLLGILTGRLGYSCKFKGCSVIMNDGSQFEIFRQISRNQAETEKMGHLFIVCFKFRHLSFKANKIASVIPMLLIAGHPGFISKCYAVNRHNGYWQGMYQWKSKKYCEAYKKSFVFRMMNKRAIAETIHTLEPGHQNLNIFIENRI